MDKRWVFAGALVMALGVLPWWPYAYFQFLRIVAFLLFGALTWMAFERRETVPGIVALGAMILFNPLLPIYLPRAVWLGLDPLGAVVAVMLYFWLLGKRAK